ncbi:MAG: sigma 54-interacting transcriptional regulator [Gammaproteobacteria bacterium]|nr:sigma 54-interacting transcriptional regulator [Gammaproteobacteria bacterium]
MADPGRKSIPVAELASVIEGLDDPAIVLALDYRILAVNQVYLRRYGDGRPLPRRHCHEVLHGYDRPCDQSGELCPLKQTLESGLRHRVLHVHHTTSGREHVEVETRPVRDGRGQVVAVLEVLRSNSAAATIPVESRLIGESPRFMGMLEMMHRVAPSPTTVLLLGETGTGKEMVARAIHRQSSRADAPFVAVECSGMPEALVESELFGHERGAFTGAHNRKIGLVETAKGGTLFLDEIGEIPLPLQVKLLRLLETGRYRRVGGVEEIQAQFRLICATHRGLKAMVANGEFREDLYYRINIFPIVLPGLRERGGDVPLLIDTLLQQIAPDRGLVLDQKALQALCEYRFPGNVRELRNILERATLLADGGRIELSHLPEEVVVPENSLDTATGQDIVSLDEAERRYLRLALARHMGDRSALADRLGISERTLYRKLAHAGLSTQPPDQAADSTPGALAAGAGQPVEG